MVSTKRKKIHCGWLTDIHLEFLTNNEAAAFVRNLALKELDCLFLTGDISTANQIEDHLQLFEELYKAPVYFVLGNHDYYGGDIESVRSIVKKICQRSRWLHWLPTSGVVSLNNYTCLIGHDGWSDGRLGNYKDSKVLLNDYLKIQDFVQAGGVGRLALLNSLGDQAASYIQKVLPVALKQYSHIIVLTHVPPFTGACWHQGEISADDWLPHFSCKAMGDVLKDCMGTAHDKQMTVFCGHTHGRGECQILPNLLVKTGEAKYGAPKLQEIVEIS